MVKDKGNIVDMNRFLLRTVPGAHTGERARNLATDQAMDREDRARARRGIDQRQRLLEMLGEEKGDLLHQGISADSRMDQEELRMRAGIKDLQELLHPSSTAPKRGKLLHLPSRE